MMAAAALLPRALPLVVLTLLGAARQLRARHRPPGAPAHPGRARRQQRLASAGKRSHTKQAKPWRRAFA